jgi:hypothetical protein
MSEWEMRERSDHLPPFLWGMAAGAIFVALLAGVFAWVWL